MTDLFGAAGMTQSWEEQLAPGAVVLRQFASPSLDTIMGSVQRIETEAPFRHMVTPGGLRMSVAMTNCGAFGWVSDQAGYRYDSCDPQTGKPWPVMPEVFSALARRAAQAAGFRDFLPDACLINRYAPGTRMSLHQDKNERDIDQPIVSVSIGVPAVFLFGGWSRNDRPIRALLTHGDIVVWGGPARLRFHGIAPLKEDRHAATGEYRFNLTFRKAA